MVVRGTKTKGSTTVQFLYGGVAGACSRTIVAPLDRVKILLQVSTQGKSMTHELGNIVRHEGIRKLWKGNMLNCARVLPYSAMQFGVYDYVKLTKYNNRITVKDRMVCGAVAGGVATTLTHPIDVVRHRLLLKPSINTFSEAVVDVLRTDGLVFKERGLVSFFKGYGSTMAGAVPFIAVNFCTFDTLKDTLLWQSTLGILSMGAIAALVSQSICYPLDTVRRRMQVKQSSYKNGLDVVKHIIYRENIKHFYAGIVANSLKIVPNNSIRFLVYESLRTFFLEEPKKIE